MSLFTNSISLYDFISILSCFPLRCGGFNDPVGLMSRSIQIQYNLDYPTRREKKERLEALQFDCINIWTFTDDSNSISSSFASNFWLVEWQTVEVTFHLFLPTTVVFNWFGKVMYFGWTKEHPKRYTGDARFRTARHIFIRIPTIISSVQLVNTIILSNRRIWKWNNFGQSSRSVLWTRRYQFKKSTMKKWQKQTFRRKLSCLFHCLITYVWIWLLWSKRDFCPFSISEPGLNRARRKLTPLLPTSNSFDIPDGYQTSASGEHFLIVDQAITRKKRMLVFASPKQLELLFESSSIFLDGTFLTTPPFFNQVFTIHGLKFDSGKNHLTSLR